MKLRYKKRLDAPYPKDPLTVSLSLPAGEMALLLLALASGYQALARSCASEGLPEQAPDYWKKHSRTVVLFRELEARREAAEVEAQARAKAQEEEVGE